MRELFGTERSHRLIAGALIAGLLAMLPLAFPLAAQPAFAASGGLLLQVGGPSRPFTDNPPPLFSGPAILPGGSMDGEVSVENESDVSGVMSLRAGDVVEHGGASRASDSYSCSTPGGLAGELEVQVWATVGASHDEVYDGTVCQLEERNALLAQDMVEGSRASFSVIAALPRSAGDDLMGASATWTFVWQLTASTGGVVGRVDVAAQSSAGHASAGSGHPGGTLAFTGTDLRIVMALGLAAIVAGVCIGLLSELRGGSRRLDELAGRRQGRNGMG